MIDIHSHILFGVDDGAKTVEESQALLQEEFHQGVSTIIVTPHQRKGMFECDKQHIISNFLTLKEWQLSHLPELKLYLGAEIYWNQGAYDEIVAGNYLSLANSPWYLLEFPYDITFEEVYDAVQQLSFIGKRVVIAHLERYGLLRRQYDEINALRELGALVQVNASSLLAVSVFDKRRHRHQQAQWLLKHHLVDVVASDVHNQTTRRLVMKEAYDKLKKHYGETLADHLCHYNALETILRSGGNT